MLVYRRRGMSTLVVAMVIAVVLIVAADAAYLKTSGASHPLGPATFVDISAGASTNSASLGYSPSNITVVIGVNNTVIWTNGDSAPHTVTALDGSFDSGQLSPGFTFTYTFPTPGTYHYHCTIHSFMMGTVVVKAA